MSRAPGASAVRVAGWGAKAEPVDGRMMWRSGKRRRGNDR